MPQVAAPDNASPLLSRRFTAPDTDVFETIAFHADELVIEDDVAIIDYPEGWSRTAAELFITSASDHAAETRVQDILNRLIGTATEEARHAGILKNDTDAETFYDELRYALATRLIGIDPALIAGASPKHTGPQLTISNDMINQIVGGSADKAITLQWQNCTDTTEGTRSLQFGQTAESPAVPNLMINLYTASLEGGAIDFDHLRHLVLLSVILFAVPFAPKLRLGFCNLAATLMATGIAYDSDTARKTAAKIAGFIQTEATRFAADLAVDAEPVVTLAQNPILTLFMGIISEGCEPLPRLDQINSPDAGLFGDIYPCVHTALKTIDATNDTLQMVEHHIIGHRDLTKAPKINQRTLQKLGFDQIALNRIADYMPEVDDLRLVFTPWILGHTFCRTILALTQKQIDSPTFLILSHLGFSDADIDAANQYCYGHHNVASCRAITTSQSQILASRATITAEATLRMATTVQTAINGTVVPTLPLPAGCGAQFVETIIVSAWRQGLKGIQLDYHAGKNIALHPVTTGKRPSLFRASVKVASAAARPWKGKARLHQGTQSQPTTENREIQKSL